MAAIQKAAPGPPTAMAVATPAMLPLPMVAAMAVVSAWKGEMSPDSCSPLSLRRAPLMTRPTAVPNFRKLDPPAGHGEHETEDGEHADRPGVPT